MTMALLMTSATMGLLRNSSMCHLLLLCADTLHTQVFPGEASVEWVMGSDLLQDVTRAGVLPRLAETVCKLDEDFPVGFGPRQWAQGAPNSLYVLIDIGH